VTAPANNDVRTARLSAEPANRKPLGQDEPVLAFWAAVLLGGFIILAVFGTSAFVVVPVVVLYLAAVASCINIKGERSLAHRVVHRLREKWRRKHGEHIYVNENDVRYGDPAVDPGWELPVPLGTAFPLTLDGTGMDDMFILLHKNPGEPDYLSVVLMVEGVPGGERADANWSSTWQQFGDALGSLARRGSFLRSIQMCHRSVPADFAPHLHWVNKEVNDAYADLPEEARRLLLPALDSYEELISDAAPLAEDYRDYVVLRFPLSGALLREARKVADRHDAAFEGAMAKVLAGNIEKVIEELQSADMGSIELLGEQRTCAVFRAFIDPSFKLERHKGASWENCWPSYIGDQRSDTMVVNPRGEHPWYTRVATVPPGAIAPVNLGPKWLDALEYGVAPDPGDEETLPAPTIRTLSVRMDLIPADIARTAAKRDLTDDMANQIAEQKKGKLSDGMNEMMMDASTRRREDLMPGSGHHGVIYGFTIAVTGRDEDDIDRACRRIETAASDSAIERLNWCTDRHDVAVFNTLPLGRGLSYVAKYQKDYES